MATLAWCVLVLVVISCQVNDAASELTVTSTPTEASIAENVAVNATVVTVSSTGTGITYSLESQSPDTDPKIFAIDGTSGVVKVADKTHLDLETVEMYILVIKATETGGSQDSGTVTVTINVNKPPTFAEDRYTACVNKSSPGGTIVKQITATDEDDGDILTYSINASPIFEVEPGNGTIKVKAGQTLGETPATYNLTLKANDDDSTPLTGTTTVSINVADPCPVVTTTPVVTTALGDTPPPSFATTITASFCLFLVSDAVHLMHIW